MMCEMRRRYDDLLFIGWYFGNAYFFVVVYHFEKNKCGSLVQYRSLVELCASEMMSDVMRYNLFLFHS